MQPRLLGVILLALCRVPAGGACLQCDRRTRLLHQDFLSSAASLEDQIRLTLIRDHAYVTYRDTSQARRGVVEHRVEAEEGGEAVLNCFLPWHSLLQGRPEYHYTWAPGLPGTKPLEEGDFRTLVLTEEPSVVLNQLRVDEQGTYRCSLQDRNATVFSTVTFLLTVTVVPTQTPPRPITLPTLPPRVISSPPFPLTGNMVLSIVAMVTTLSLVASLGFTVALGAHIRQSTNVHWNSLLRRRSKSSVVCLEWLVADKTLVGRLRRGDFSPVVVVDDHSQHLMATSLNSESLAGMMLGALKAEVPRGSVQIFFLKGGFATFSEAYPELCSCTSPGAEPSTSPGAEPPASLRKTPLYDQGGPVELLPFLFLGSALHSSRRETLAAAGITAVLNVSSTCPSLYQDELRYLRLTVEDSLAADIGACFSHAIAFIDSVKEQGGRVLVHCQAGISRSATICLAYLMHARRLGLSEAFDFVRQRRQVISPNLAFMGQLLQFETDGTQVEVVALWARGPSPAPSPRPQVQFKECRAPITYH
ncbi:hypothetical protein NHX12_028419, partial [Muraenolepis orangiensis]